MPCVSVGVGGTCRAILAASAAAGLVADLHTPRFEGAAPDGVPVQRAIPRRFGRLPFRPLRPMISPWLHNRYLQSVGEGDIAYLWPSVPLAIYEKLARRGIPIVTEAVNTRMASAKEVLDGAYDALGLRPGHTITAARIAEQDQRHALCAAIFAPSPMVERSFAGAPAKDRLIAASYGTWVPARAPPRPPREPGAPVVFVFVGAVCVRKGAHLLLEAWRKPPPRAVLRLVGHVEPAIRNRYADVLNSATVQSVGFSRNVAAELAFADVALLPSIEEGDPIATYEAAAHGLPVIASEAGAGRIGAETSAICIIRPEETEAFRGTLAAFAAERALREDLGAAARRAVMSYDWSRTGPQRFARFFARRDAACL